MTRVVVGKNIAVMKWVPHSAYKEVNEAAYVSSVCPVCNHIDELERVATYCTNNRTTSASLVLIRDSKKVVSVSPCSLFSHLLITGSLV